MYPDDRRAYVAFYVPGASLPSGQDINIRQVSIASAATTPAVTPVARGGLHGRIQSMGSDVVAELFMVSE